MQQTIAISPLKHEFWPLEGVVFSADDENDLLTILCHVYGDRKFKNFVNLRFLDGIDISRDILNDVESLYACRLNGRADSINNYFRGFGIVFKQDFDPGGSLVVEVKGPCDYQFLVKLE